MQKHFVTFYSPGTFFSETTTRPIDAWDINVARAMSDSIVERYDARPFGFRFSTRERGDEDLDSREVARSPMHWIGCKVLTLAEIEAMADPADEILISNMRANGWDRIVRSVAGWKWSQPLGPDDVVLDP